jgi:hypothetical protein
VEPRTIGHRAGLALSRAPCWRELSVWVDALQAGKKMRSLVPIGLVCRHDHSQVLLSRLNFSFHLAIWLRMKRGGPCLTYSQALQYVLHESRLEVLALVAVQPTLLAPWSGRRSWSLGHPPLKMPLG